MLLKKLTLAVLLLTWVVAGFILIIMASKVLTHLDVGLFTSQLYSALIGLVWASICLGLNKTYLKVS